MYKKFVTFLLCVGLFFGTIDCAIITDGESSWEFYIGLHTQQHSEKPSKIGIQSDVVDKIVESFTDGEMSEAE